MNDPFTQKKTYPNTGVMFDRRPEKIAGNRAEKASDFGGEFEISDDVLQYIMQNARSGKVKLEIAGWIKQGAKGMFLSLKLQTPYEARKAPANGYQDFAQPQRQQPQQQRNDYAQASGGNQRMPWEI